MIAPHQGERGRLVAGCLPRQRSAVLPLFGLDRLVLEAGSGSRAVVMRRVSPELSASPPWRPWRLPWHPLRAAGLGTVGMLPAPFKATVSLIEHERGCGDFKSAVR